MDKESSILDMGLHIRHSSKAMKQITSQIRKEIRGEKKVSSNQRQHMNLLMDVWKSLPESEKQDYETLSSLHSRKPHKLHSPKKSKLPKENDSPTKNYVTQGNFYRTRTLPLDQLDNSYICDEPQMLEGEVWGVMNEIPFRTELDTDDIINKIYVSDIRAANDLTLLRHNNIYAILTFGEQNAPSNFASIKGGYLTISLEDNSSAVLLKELRTVERFLENKLKKGNVLVHCFQGKSRSCAAVVGFLMKKFSLSYNTAFDVVKKGHPQVDISPQFVKQLKQLERQCVPH